MPRSRREINIFNIAFLDVITGAMGAFVLLVLLLIPYYTGASVDTLAKQQTAQAAVEQARENVQHAQQQASNASVQTQLQQAHAHLDDADQQLAAIKQQLDQLSSQNRRLTSLDDQQQQELKQTRAQIAALQQQAAQTTSQTLDRAEQRLAQADEAVQSGDIQALRKLLSQARADLAMARQQLDALQQQLNEAQAALAQERSHNAALQQQLADSQQREASLDAQNATLKQQLDNAAAAVSQAQQERDQAQAVANAQEQALDQAEPATYDRVLLDIRATSACGTTNFNPLSTPLGSASFPGFASNADATAFGSRGSVLSFAPLEAPNLLGGTQHPYHMYYIFRIVQKLRFVVGLQAATQPPPNCQIVFGYSWTTPLAGDHLNFKTIMSPKPVPIRDTRPVLLVAFPPQDMKQPFGFAPDETAAWKQLISGSASAPAAAGSREHP